MKKLFFITCLVLFISCNSQSNRAIDYNNTLLNEYVLISNEINSYLEVIKDTSQTDKLEKLKKQILIDIEKSKKEIGKLSDFNGNIKFKKSLESVLTAYEQGVKTEYDAIATYQKLPSSEKTIDKKNKAEQHAMHADENISQKEDYFILMQQEFAKENNIELE